MMDVSKKSSILTIIRRDKWFKENFDVSDPDYIYDILGQLSEQQGNYFWALHFNHKYTELYEFLKSHGLKPLEIK